MHRFEVLRYDASAPGDSPRFQTYELDDAQGLSVLEALLKIQDELDPTLAFRSSCRGAICGSCAMSINGKLDLACRVQLRNLPTNRLVLEPLPKFEILRDLVVEMDPFWEKYERVRPWLHREIDQAKEIRMSPKERERIDQYVNCILCGLCYASCPVVTFDDDFTGPAALAKLYRFLADSREERDGQTLDQQDGPSGAWGCHTITRCIQACPKDVRPTDGIAGTRRKLLVHKFKKLLPPRQVTFSAGDWQSQPEA